MVIIWISCGYHLVRGRCTPDRASTSGAKGGYNGQPNLADRYRGEYYSGLAERADSISRSWDSQ